jgi:hypothetical protein
MPRAPELTEDQKKARLLQDSHIMGEHDDDLEVSPVAESGAQSDATRVAAALASGLKQIAAAVERGLGEVAAAIASADAGPERHATHER